MTGFFQCLEPACKRVTPLLEDTAEHKCAACGSTHGEWLTNEEFKRRYDAGGIYDLGDARKRRK